MDLLRFLLILVFTVFTLADEPETTTTSEITTTMIATTSTEKSLCNCDSQCPESKVIGLDKSDEGNDNEDFSEDEDEDDDLTICARNRDMIDRTFPSFCHMMCTNRCNIFRVIKVKQDHKRVRYAAVSREHFYKLHDGAC